MKKFFRNENGFVENDVWLPHCWVNVECPDASDIRFLTDELKVPTSFIESVADMEELPRFDHEGEWMLTILRIPVKTRSGERVPYRTVPLGIILCNEVVVTICYAKSELIPDFIDYTRMKGIHIDQQADFILRFEYSTTYWFLRYLKEIHRDVDKAEDQIGRKVRNEWLIEIMHVQNSLVYFNTSIQDNQMLLERMPHLFADKYDAPLLDDVDIEIRQAANTINVYSTILMGMQDSLESIISNNVNDIMKKMTVVSIVLMIPTLIASFYGMNVAVAFGSSKYAFFLIIAASMTLALVTFWILKKVKWV